MDLSRPRGESKATITDEKMGGKKKERKKGNVGGNVFGNGSVDPASSSLLPWIEERKEKFLTGEHRERKGEVEGTLPAAPILILD